MLEPDRLADGRLAGRLEAGRADDFFAPPLALDMLALAEVVLAEVFLAEVDLVVVDLDVPAAVLRVVPPVLVDFRAPVDALAVDDGLDVDRDDDVLALVVLRERVALGVAALAVDIVFAAAVRAFAAVDMDLVAVFMARIALDIVFADAVALVAAAVILPAAEFTLVAAVETPRAAVAGVVLLLVTLRVDRDAVDRDVEGRDADERDVVLRDDLARGDAARDVVLRDDRDAVLRLADDPLRAERALAVRDVPVLLADLVLGRLAVPPDALRLPDLLRAVLAELRRVAARVVV